MTREGVALTLCHCEERSDVAIPLPHHPCYPFEIATLRSQ